MNEQNLKCYIFIFRDFFSEYLLFPLVSFWELEDIDLKSHGLDRYSDSMDQPGKALRVMKRSYVARLQGRTNLTVGPCTIYLALCTSIFSPVKWE